MNNENTLIYDFPKHMSLIYANKIKCFNLSNKMCFYATNILSQNLFLTFNIC